MVHRWCRLCDVAYGEVCIKGDRAVRREGQGEVGGFVRAVGQRAASPVSGVDPGAAVVEGPCAIRWE